MTALAMQPTDLSLVALTPTDVAPVQQQLAGWCRQKIAALGAELREQRQNLRQAKTMKWKHSGWANAVSKTKRRMIYYAKIKAAVQAGFLVVPNFPIDVITVRVQRQTPNEGVDVTRARAELLPPGQGRYVDDVLLGQHRDRTYTNSEGKQQTVTDFHPDAYDDEVDFPASLVKPVVMAATERAMALRIFDRLGIVRGGKRSDPIVVGQIIDPKTNSTWELRDSPTCVSFFIAWWLDTRSL